MRDAARALARAWYDSRMAHCFGKGWFVFGGLLLAAVLLDAHVGRSQPAGGSLAARVARLERRVGELQRRVSTLEAASFKKNGAGYTLAVNGARVDIGPRGGVTVHAATRLRLEAGPTELPIGRASFNLASGSTTTLSAPPSNPCDPPYSIDVHGIRHVRPECLK